jgi:hypothetical protein
LKSLHLSFSPKRLTENCLGQSKGLESDGAIKKAFVMMTGTGGSVQQGCRGCFTNPRGFNLLVINEWGQETGIFIPAFGEPGNLAVCANIELAMMQLIHSRKALETDPIAYMQELQEFHYSGRGVYHQRIQHIQPR